MSKPEQESNGLFVVEFDRLTSRCRVHTLEALIARNRLTAALTGAPNTCVVVDIALTKRTAQRRAKEFETEITRRRAEIANETVTPLPPQPKVTRRSVFSEFNGLLAALETDA